jgi:cephalosporin-C deacetylase
VPDVEEIDGTYGYGLDDLLAVAPAPAPDGFDDLWASWHAVARGVPADVRVLATTTVESRTVHLVEHAAADGLRLRAWLALPVGGAPPRVGVVHGHGYGGRAAPSFERVPDDAAVLFAVARGLGALNVGVGAPSVPDEHVLHGIGSVRTSVLGRCAVDLWHAASALLAVTGDLPLYYVGESFGGGIGALALPWDDRFVGATLVVPSFGHHGLRLGLACEGSGEAVRRHAAAHPDVRAVLPYVDASVAATRVTVPVRVECARRDRVVPPPGQLAVANGVANGVADLELVLQPAGHTEYPGVEEVRREAWVGTRDHLSRCLQRAAP